MSCTVMHTENESQLLEHCLLDERASPLTGGGDKNPHMQHRAPLRAKITTGI